MYCLLYPLWRHQPLQPKDHSNRMSLRLAKGAPRKRSRTRPGTLRAPSTTTPTLGFPVPRPRGRPHPGENGNGLTPCRWRGNPPTPPVHGATREKDAGLRWCAGVVAGPG